MPANRFVMPTAAQSTVENGVSRTRWAAGDSAAASTKKTFADPLLLVEDKPELRAMLRKALERSGYAVDEAADGTTAVAKLRARRYLLVLTDLKLPGCSGLDVLR